MRFPCSHEAMNSSSPRVRVEIDIEDSEMRENLVTRKAGKMQIAGALLPRPKKARSRGISAHGPLINSGEHDRAADSDQLRHHHPFDCSFRNSFRTLFPLR